MYVQSTLDKRLEEDMYSLMHICSAMFNFV